MQEQQNQGMQNQQGVMQQPPNVLSGKDELYLTDMLTWNLMAAKKAHFYAQHCQIEAMRAEAEKVGQMHQLHYEKILGHLSAHENQNAQQYMQQ
ncbi:hypothetical protein D1B31_13780 [Neobacillus notoginsengisoli]|uniref:Spore coat protein n=1 Tax=Neobacillus notoginsengisoli TaxID=1578198 RepID=A0A417YSN9_9BACI|nr:hypothetical protein [Neobacillus notoginsengisoli]RHW39028.1 hypothetical protein D1B31_13780 [Neobacillus notoginsengisoli]